MGDILDSVDTKFDIVLTDNDILRIVEEQGKTGKLNDYIKQKILSEDRAAKYLKIMKDPLWRQTEPFRPECR